MADTKIKAKRYSITERMDALVLLRDNGYNYTKTHRQIGISIPSLRVWQRNYGQRMEKVSQEVEAMTKSSEKLQECKKDFMEEVYDTKLLIVKRVQMLVPTAKSIRILSDALAVLQSMEQEEKNPVPTSLLGDHNRDFILNFVNNQIAVIAPDGKMIRQSKLINTNEEDHGKN